MCKRLELPLFNDEDEPGAESFEVLTRLTPLQREVSGCRMCA